MDDLGLERASHGGVSLGGMVGMWLAANAPERVERLIGRFLRAQAVGCGPGGRGELSATGPNPGSKLRENGPNSRGLGSRQNAEEHRVRLDRSGWGPGGP